MPMLGETLKDARSRKKAKLGQVATEIRQPLDRLEALEADNYDALPDDVYTKGAIRNYALYLDLNPDEMYSLYRDRRPAAVAVRFGERTDVATRTRFTPLAYATVSLVLVILVVVALFAFGII